MDKELLIRQIEINQQELNRCESILKEAKSAYDKAKKQKKMVETLIDKYTADLKVNYGEDIVNYLGLDKAESKTRAIRWKKDLITIIEESNKPMTRNEVFDFYKDYNPLAFETYDEEYVMRMIRDTLTRSAKAEEVYSYSMSGNKYFCNLEYKALLEEKIVVDTDDDIPF